MNSRINEVAVLCVTRYIIVFCRYIIVFCNLGGNDKNAVVFNKDTEQVMAILKGHTKKVTSVIYHPEEVNHCYISNI